MNSSSIKETNIQAVRNYLMSHSGVTRVQMAKDLGLSKMTVTNIVNVLLAAHFVEERNAPEGETRGRPAKILLLSSSSPRFIGVLLDVHKAKVLFMNLLGEIISSKEILCIEGEEKNFLPQIIEEIDRIARQSLNDSVCGISISVNGTVQEDKIVDSIELFGIKDFALLTELKKRYSLPIYIENSRYCDCSLELRSGTLSGKKEALYLHIGKHIYATMVHQGKILRFDNQASEFGHISIDYNGLSCDCGNRGCLETYASTTAMEKKLRDITKLKIDFRSFCELQTKKNDSRIDWALKDMMDKIATAAVGYINLFHPEIIILGGEAASLPDRYLAKLEKSLREKTKGTNPSKVEVKKPKYRTSSSEACVLIPVTDALAGTNN